VRSLRHDRPRGPEAALRTGLARSRGDVVLVREPGSTALRQIHQTSKPVRPNYLGHVRRHTI
jgi:hypothetical protein